MGPTFFQCVIWDCNITQMLDIFQYLFKEYDHMRESSYIRHQSLMRVPLFLSAEENHP